MIEHMFDTLKKAVTGILEVEPSHLTEGELEDALVEVHRAAEMLQAAWLGYLGEFDRRGGFGGDGILSVSSWLVHRCRMAWSRAHYLVGLARSLRDMPLTRKAHSTGDITISAVRVLVRARDAQPQCFGEFETTLVDAARRLSVRDLHRLVEYWRQTIDEPQTLEETNHLHQRRRLDVSATFEGLVRIDGDLDPEGGEILLAALRSLLDPEARSAASNGDNRTPAQRRADALVDLCRSHLGHGVAAHNGGERPHLTVTVDLEVLEGRAGKICETETGMVIHPETARRLACDASISRVITRGRSEILDVGRRTRVIPAAIRRAVALRDRHCTFPGCDRPARWCDCHHCVGWIEGGPTSLQNLALLCRRHHRMLHEGGLTMRMVEGRPVVFRPDGSRFLERSPPSAA